MGMGLSPPPLTRTTCCRKVESMQLGQFNRGCLIGFVVALASADIAQVPPPGPPVDPWTITLSQPNYYSATNNRAIATATWVGQGEQRTLVAMWLYTKECNQAFWGALANGYSAMHARNDAFYVYGPHKGAPEVPTDYMSVWGDWHTKLRGAYDGLHEPSGTWFRRL